MSVFVWLDYSERERRKMLDVVDLFREHDTRDELGNQYPGVLALGAIGPAAPIALLAITVGAQFLATD